MKYKRVDVYEENNEIVIADVKDFEPKHVFECGQCFRWIKEEDSSYTGIVKGKVINVSKIGENLYFKNASFVDFQEIWYDYFDFDRDYGELKDKILLDNHMKEAIQFGHGIRLLKQDFHEMLVSFIISSNNNIPRIIKSIETLSKIGGRDLEFNLKRYYGFPELKAILEMGLEGIGQTKLGYRAPYILDTATRVMESGLGFNDLCGIEYIDAKNRLLKLKGVGSKVSDCVLLFSGIKYHVFPVDVWVKRVMEELYLKREMTLKDINSYGSEYFGENCGFAQQYLFYYAREKRIGIGK